MHINIDKNNPLLKPFEDKRKREGYTTCTAAIIKAMKLFLEHTPTHYSRLTPATKNTICSKCSFDKTDCDFLPLNDNCAGFVAN